MKPASARSSRVRSACLLLVAWAAAVPAAAKEDWQLGVNVAESWDTNVRLANPPGGKFATRASVKLTRNFRGPRWMFGLNGSAMKSFFHGRSSPKADAIFYGLGAQFGFDISSRASLSISDRFRSIYTGEDIEFVDVDEDVILPQVGQKRNHFAAGLSLQATPLLTVRIPLVWDKALFSQEEAFQPRLRNGERFATGVDFSRKLSEETAINLGYAYAHSAQAVTSADIHNVSVGVSQLLGQYTSMGVSIGASRRAGFDGNVNAVSGGLAIARELENASLSLRYGRNLGPVFGLGRDLLHDTVRLSWRRQLARSVSASANGAFSRNRDPLDAGFSYNAWGAGGGLSFALFEKVHVHGGYHYFRRTPLPGELGRQFEAHRASIQLGWNTSF